jgi:hypothetical protein
MAMDTISSIKVSPVDLLRIWLAESRTALNSPKAHRHAQGRLEAKSLHPPRKARASSRANLLDWVFGSTPNNLNRFDITDTSGQAIDLSIAEIARAASMELFLGFTLHPLMESTTEPLKAQPHHSGSH